MSIPEPKVEHHEGRGIRSCPIFPELRPILDEAFGIFGYKHEYVVAAPQYRAAANTEMGWKNANLRTEMLRLLRRAGVSILAKMVPFDAGQPTNRTPARVSLAVGLLLARQLAANHAADLFAGH